MWYAISGVWEPAGDDELPKNDPRQQLKKIMSKDDVISAETSATDWWAEHFESDAPLL